MTTDVRSNGSDPTGDAGGTLRSVDVAALVRELHRLRIENSQLLQALESRVVIEQAKGVLSERYGLALAASFELLRDAARSNRMNIHTLASKVVSEQQTPSEFARVLDRTQLSAH